MRRLLILTLVLVALNVALVAARLGHGASHLSSGGGGKRMRVGLVFDVGGRGDKSFNDAAYRGLNRAVHELGVEAEYIEPGEGSDRESGLRRLAAQKFDLIIGVGFIFSDDLISEANEYPALHFACIDYAKFEKNQLVVPPKNMVALKFREEEGAFLVGALAALRSHTQAIGFVGGMDIPLIRKFQAGYTAGAQYVCPNCKVMVGYAGVTGDSFKNPAKGKELALAQYAAGADIVFHAAGTTGLGVFEAARERDKLAIGVDSDQWDEAPGHILTSMTKEVDRRVFETVQRVRDGQWRGGIEQSGLAQKAVDYIYDAHNRALVGDAVRVRVEELRAKIIAGEIKVPER